MRKYLIFILAIVIIFSIVGCSSQEQRTYITSSSGSSTESSSDTAKKTMIHSEEKYVAIQKPFDPHDSEQPELIAVRRSLSEAIKKYGLPFKVDMTTVGMSSPNSLESSFSFNVLFDDIVRTQILEVNVYALDEKMQKGFEVYLNPDCKKTILKDMILCSILAIAPELNITQAEAYYHKMTDGYDWKGRSKVVEVNGYKLHISEGGLLRTGSGAYRGYPMLHVVAQDDLLPRHKNSEYKSISTKMNLRDLACFTGTVKKIYEDGYSYVLEISNSDGVYAVYYMEDKFAGCFTTGQSYVFYGQYAGARDGYNYSLLLDGFENEVISSHEEEKPVVDVLSQTSKGDISDIAVKFQTNYIDGDRLHIKVFMKNNSEEKFSGNVYVTFYSADGKDRLGSDTVIVDELLPGRESWANVIVDVYKGTPTMTVDFSEVSFTPIKEVVAEIDIEATEKTKKNYYWNFEGVSWYNDISDIAVYKNGTCIVILKDNPKEKGQFYASTIWSCGNNYGVGTVQVIDKKGTILSVYGDGDMVSVKPNVSGEIALSVDTHTSEKAWTQKTTPPNDTTIPVATPQSPSATSNPTFTGSTCIEINYNGDGMPVSNVTDFTGTDTVIVAGRLEGVTGENNITFRWVFPDGFVREDKCYYMKNDETTNLGISAEYIGSGSSSVSVIIDSTGEVLATYYFTVNGASTKS